VKWAFSILFITFVASAVADTPTAKPFEDYQIILDREPFGAPPDPSLIPERVVPVSESFAAQMQLSAIYELDDGNLRVAVTDKKDNSYFSLIVGGKDETVGIELLDADYEKGEATLQKGEEVVVLSMNDTAGGQVLNTAERQDRVKQAEERRMSYAERRRQRMLERQKPVEIPKPMYTGEELEKHLQEYQMQVIREGLPPLPVQLTPDRDAQLVAEGFLPPVDEEGYEVVPEEETMDEEYYEEE
jgi:hypothetical protein